jgi:hypothetical protein
VIIRIHRNDRWCVVTSARPGAWITTACGDSFEYRPICIATPGVLAPGAECAVCEGEAQRTQGGVA